jgi:hypothetical protein
MGIDIPKSPRRDILQVRVDDRIHQRYLHPGISPEDLCLEGEPPELGFPEVRLVIPVLERSVLVAAPMRLPRIGTLVWGGSRMLEGFLEHRLVEESGDEVLHAALLIGKIICDKRHGIHDPVSPLSKFRLDSGPIQLYRTFVTLPFLSDATSGGQSGRHFISLLLICKIRNP